MYTPGRGKIVPCNAMAKNSDCTIVDRCRVLTFKVVSAVICFCLAFGCHCLLGSTGMVVM